MLNKNLSAFKSFVLIFALLSIQNQFAQASDTIWTNIFGGADDEFGHFAEQTNDGGYIVTGATQASYFDLWLVKTNSSGHVSWRKNYGTS